MFPGIFVAGAAHRHVSALKIKMKEDSMSQKDFEFEWDEDKNIVNIFKHALISGMLSTFGMTGFVKRDMILNIAALMKIDGKPRRANADLDNPLLTDAQLEEFRVAEKKEKKMEKVKVKLSEIQNKVGRTNWAFLKKASNAKNNKNIQPTLKTRIGG